MVKEISYFNRCLGSAMHLTLANCTNAFVTIENRKIVSLHKFVLRKVKI